MPKNKQRINDSLREQILAKIAASNLLSEEEHAYLAERLQRQYGLLWENRPEDVETRLRSELPVLQEVPERRILPRFDDTQPNLYEQSPQTAPNHILIEGDNLHALSTLAFTHEGKVDVIYIDPPYNTGNKDFRYNDRFVEKEDAYRHSAWLGFMHRRLTLAHRLLKDTGVIFISIDDNEQAQLKLLCDEVFGEGNFVGNLIWKSRQIVDSRNQNNVSTDHEYVLVYGYTENVKLRGKAISRDKYSNPDNDSRGAWMSNSILGLATKENRPNLHYDLIDPATQIAYPCPPNTGWRYSQETMREKIVEKRIVFPKKTDGRPREKKFLAEVSSDFTGFSSVLLEDVGFTLHGTREVREIIDDTQTFAFPKPITLVQTIIEQASTKTSLILDFFAGSGTTLHAVMALNAADGGERQCILVTNNENKIAEEVCYERNRRVIAGYTKPNGEAVAGFARNALRYYRTEFVGRERTSVNREELTRRALDMLCIKENCYTEATPPEMNSASMRFFTNDAEGAPILGSSMLVVLPSDYMDEQFQEAVRFIASLPERAQRIKVYVFSPSDDPFAEEFDEVLHRVELCALPEAILRAYREILPEQNNVGNEELDEESEE